MLLVRLMLDLQLATANGRMLTVVVVGGDGTNP